jgi:hypothetical protein
VPYRSVFLRTSQSENRRYFCSIARHPYRSISLCAKPSGGNSGGNHGKVGKMIWQKHKFENSPALAAAVQNRLETIFTANGGPKAMLLVAECHAPLVETWWLRLADTRYLSVFPEFESATSNELPKRAALLVGHPTEFEKLFEYSSS